MIHSYTLKHNSEEILDKVMEEAGWTDMTRTEWREISAYLISKLIEFAFSKCRTQQDMDGLMGIFKFIPAVISGLSSEEVVASLEHLIYSPGSIVTEDNFEIDMIDKITEQGSDYNGLGQIEDILGQNMTPKLAEKLVQFEEGRKLLHKLNRSNNDTDKG